MIAALPFIFGWIIGGLIFEHFRSRKPITVIISKTPYISLDENALGRLIEETITEAMYNKTVFDLDERQLRGVKSISRYTTSEVINYIQRENNESSC